MPTSQARRPRSHGTRASNAAVASGANRGRKPDPDHVVHGLHEREHHQEPQPDRARGRAGGVAAAITAEPVADEALDDARAVGDSQSNDAAPG